MRETAASRHHGLHVPGVLLFLPKFLVCNRKVICGVIKRKPEKWRTHRDIYQQNIKIMCVFWERGEIVHKSKLIRKKNYIPLNVNQRTISHLQQGLMGSYAQAIVSLSGRRQAGTRGLHSASGTGPVACGLIFGQFTGTSVYNGPVSNRANFNLF